MQSKTIWAIAVFASLGTLAKAQDKSSEKDVLTIYKGDHSYKEVSVSGKTTEVYVDDKQVAAGEIHHYDSLIQALRTEVRGDDNDSWNRADDERDREQAQRDREQAQRDQEQAQRDQEQAQRDQEQAQRDRERDLEQAQRDREQAIRDKEQAQRERQQAQEQAQRDREQAQREREQAQRDQQQAGRDREQADRDREQGERDRERAEEERKMISAIIQFFVDKKIVADQAHLNAFVLTDAGLSVNGVKQPKEVHQALKERYSEWVHNGIAYGCDRSSNYIQIGFSGDCCQ